MRPVLAIVLLVVCTGCPRPGPVMIPPGDRPALLPVDAWPGTHVLQQRVTARWQDREDGFNAVLQKRPGALTLIGLGPVGSVAFVIQHSESGEVTFENRTGRDVPFAPEHIVADVQRVFYPWLDAEACDACRRQGEALDLLIQERFNRGRLSQRTFERSAAPEQGTVTISYENWQDGVARQAVSTNEWYGYQLAIETFEAQQVD